jgi:hypothetical protein
MPATRLTMRKIREVLRLFFNCHLTKRQIATSCKIARSTVSEYLMRFAASGLSWPLSAETEDAKLEALLFPPVAAVVEQPRQSPDFVYIHRELRRTYGCGPKADALPTAPLPSVGRALEGSLQPACACHRTIPFSGTWEQSLHGIYIPIGRAINYSNRA